MTKVGVALRVLLAVMAAAGGLSVPVGVAALAGRSAALLAGRVPLWLQPGSA